MDYGIVSPDENVSIKQNQSILQSAPSKAAKITGFSISLFLQTYSGKTPADQQQEKYI